MTDRREPEGPKIISNPANLHEKRILLGISGGIAAYKTPDLVRKLKQAGAEVRVMMTESAERFVTPLALQAVTGSPPERELFAAGNETAEGNAMPHIELARWADLLILAPATADLMACLAQGRAQNLVCSVCLALESTKPRLLAPAMNTSMWLNAATRKTVLELNRQGWRIAGPAEGDQACGEEGPGRMLEPEELTQIVATSFASGRLSGRTVVVNAGPTQEALDPARYIGNRSSGRMGFALARAAAEAGARVELIAGPVNLETPPGVRRTDVVSAEQMKDAVLARVGSADIFIACAAVADYRPVQCADQKIKRHSCGEYLQLNLKANPDIVMEVAKLEKKPFILAFAAETENPLANARDKLERKGADMIAVNDVSQPGIGFGSDNNAIALLSHSSEEAISWPTMSKEQLARQLIAQLADVACG